MSAARRRFQPTFLTDLSIEGNVSYGRHTYRFDRPILSAPQASEKISFGDDVDTAPRWIAGARVRLAPEQAPLEAEIEWAFLDEYFMDAANTAVYPGHNLVNLEGRLENHGARDRHIRIAECFRQILRGARRLRIRDRTLFPRRGTGGGVRLKDRLMTSMISKIAPPEFGAPMTPAHPSDEARRLLALRRSTSADLLAGPGPDDATLDAMLEIAARVPDHRKICPFRFVVISGDARGRIGGVLAERVRRNLGGGLAGSS